MIAHLRGKLLHKEPNHATIECAGVGYGLTISVATFSELPNTGSELAMFVHTHVREDALALFGFLRRQDKALFERLISVSGIGPRMAINVLSGMSAEMLVSAIKSSDVAQLTKIPGIGKKTAERVVLELKDKLDEFAAAPSAPARSATEDDVLSALVNLGYQRGIAEKAVAAAAAHGGANFESLFREAMANLRR
jgi:Holliday junction DNA helicase RuvA